MEQEKIQLTDEKIVSDQIGSKSGEAYKHIALFLFGVIALTLLLGLLTKSDLVLISGLVGIVLAIPALFIISKPVRACYAAMRAGKYRVVIDTVKDIVGSPDDNKTYIIELGGSEQIYLSNVPLKKGDQVYLVVADTTSGMYTCANYYPLNEYSYTGNKEIELKVQEFETLSEDMEQEDTAQEKPAVTAT